MRGGTTAVAFVGRLPRHRHPGFGRRRLLLLRLLIIISFINIPAKVIA